MTTQITFTAPILLPSDPSTALQAATKQYVDNNYVPDARTVSAGTGLSGGGALSANQTISASFGTTSGTICQGNDSRVTGAAPAASPSFTGTASFGGAMVQTPVALTDASTIAVNAALGNTFRVTLGASRIMGAPSNATDGQMILFAIKQPSSGGPFTITTWTTGTGGYEFGTDVTSPTLSTTASKTDYIGFIYSSSASLWHCLAWARGY
jgi:hypothetical protein